MSHYRRWFVDGGTYFFTVVTYGRRPLFADCSARKLLGDCLRDVASELPFETVAIVLLPDHLHVLWTLPRNDHDYSTRWHRIKSEFTSRWRKAGGKDARVSTSKRRRGHRGIWQRRFYEHTIRDEQDLENHADYIHYNPVKHGLVKSPADWESSSFHRFVALGHYPIDWGSTEPIHLRDWDLE